MSEMNINNASTNENAKDSKGCSGALMGWGLIAVIMSVCIGFTLKPENPGFWVRTALVVSAAIGGGCLGLIGALIGNVCRKFAHPSFVITNGGMWELLKIKVFWAIGPQVIGLLIGTIIGVAITGGALSEHVFKKKDDSFAEVSKRIKMKNETSVEKPALDLSNVKPLPLTNAENEQIDKLKSLIKEAGSLSKGEFETLDEVRKRRKQEEEKVLIEFSNNPVCKNIYEYVCKTRSNPYLSYDANTKSIMVGELNNSIMGITELCDYMYNIDLRSADEVDFAGIIKTPKDALKDYYGFKCSIEEAKQIKKNLGGTWDCQLKLWLRFNPESQAWSIVKGFVMPVNKTPK